MQGAWLSRLGERRPAQASRYPPADARWPAASAPAASLPPTPSLD